jgi:SAM-dependent methyltransferase
MKVLDIGCGAGNVSLLAAEIVGPSGQVVGVDMNPAVVDEAQSRALAAGQPNVSLVAGDIRDVSVDTDFDAVVGRLVLMYSADPASTLKAAGRFVRDGGVAAFYEMSVDAELESLPVLSCHQFLGHLVSETFRRAGVETSMGLRLHQVFVDAGFEAPRMFCHALTGGGRDFVEAFVSAFASNVLRSMMPMILEYGVATAEEIDIERFDQRYLDEVLGQDGVIQWFPFVAAFGHKRTSTF